MPYDQIAVAHRDSAYSHITWVASELENYAQLRFFDKVEGGVCLTPSWDSYAALAEKNPTLKHLVGPADFLVEHSPIKAGQKVAQRRIWAPYPIRAMFVYILWVFC